MEDWGLLTLPCVDVDGRDWTRVADQRIGVREVGQEVPVGI